MLLIRNHDGVQHFVFVLFFSMLQSIMYLTVIHPEIANYALSFNHKILFNLIIYESTKYGGFRGMD